MDCSFINKNLFAILEEKLTPVEMAAAKAHIRTCSICTLTSAKFIGTIGIIGKDKSREVNPYISTRTLSLLDTRYAPAKEMQVKVFNRLLQPAMLALSLAIAVLLGFSLGKTGINGIPSKTTGGKDLQSARSELFISDMTNDEQMLFPNP